ncbi:MAG TPA: TetR/AcrR family transcriptional regulator [Xanthobacteraceae bacterium]|nr:TetR/AcrR family transcriptional regulator [Xanthobacteraceae bacterium]
MIVKALKKGQALHTDDGREILAPDASKGERTRTRILDEAAALASENGVSAVTLGPLAERLGMSKSGLFAHFKSKEALQVEVLARTSERFVEAVIAPIRQEKDRAKRLPLFFANWLDWIEHPSLGSGRGGCPILAAYFEFDDVPGPVREAAANHNGQLYAYIRRLVHFARPDADADAMAAAIDGLSLSHLLRVRLINDRDARKHTMSAFDALLKNPPLQRGA